MACAQAKHALAAGTVDEETIRSLFDSIESLTLDKQLAEKNLVEMKQLVKKINWIPEIQSEVLELNTMNSTVLELKNHIDELVATREGISTVLFHSQAKAKRIMLVEKIESGIRQLIHVLHNKRTEYVNAMYSKQNALRRVQELERDIVVNQNELNEKRKNEMETAKKRIEELRMTVSTKQLEIESIKAQVQDVNVKHSNETRELRERNRIEVDGLRKELQDLSDMHINETRELREQNRIEIEKMRKQLKGLKSTHSGEMRKLREQSNIEMANLRNQIKDQNDTQVEESNSGSGNGQAPMSNNHIPNKTKTPNQQNRSQNGQTRAPPRNNQKIKPNVGPSNSNADIQAPAETQIQENQNQSQHLNSNRRNANRRFNRRNNNKSRNIQNANQQNSESNQNSMPNNVCAPNHSSNFNRPVTVPHRQFNNSRNFDNRRRGQTGQDSNTHQKCEAPRRILTWDDI